jgi:4-diphosphocytidyl-2-C-methyl-D-erythritol kinase
VKNFNLKSFCKINLTLNVIKKLNNGYHSIQSLVTFCDIHDNIFIQKNSQLKDTILFTGKFKNGIIKNDNTITKLLYLLREKNLLKKKYFKIIVKKNIPHGSGLGGSSSNAATLLNFLNYRMNLKINKKELYKIATQIGSDTPINLYKKNTLITGVKDKFFRLNGRFGLNILIVYPNIICSTKKIFLSNKNFSKLKKKLNYNKIEKKKLINFLIRSNNDLEAAVIGFYPKIRKIIDLIKSQNGCYFSRISGSGSACIGIFSNKRSAIYTQKLIKLKFPKYWCVVSKTI